MTRWRRWTAFVKACPHLPSICSSSSPCSIFTFLSTDTDVNETQQASSSQVDLPAAAPPAATSSSEATNKLLAAPADAPTASVPSLLTEQETASFDIPNAPPPSPPPHPPTMPTTTAPAAPRLTHRKSATPISPGRPR